MLNVEMVVTDDLVPYAGNAKIHTREQIRQIARSIEEFGFNDPIAIWNGEIVEGHGRVMAAKELGFEAVPVIRLDHMTDEQRRAYTHIHNQLTMNTGFDADMLSEEMEAIDFDWSDFGFDEINIDLDLEDGYVEKEQSVDLVETFSVVIECKDEIELQETYEKLKAEGYNCRISTL